jgi:hypothetical protein
MIRAKIKKKSAFVIVTPQPYTFTSSGLLDIRNTNNVVLDSLEIDGASLAVDQSVFLLNCNNLTIKKLIIRNSKDVALQLQNCSNVKIEAVYIDTPLNGGMYLLNCENVRIKNCFFKNIKRQSGNSRGQSVQLNSCRDCIVEWCFTFCEAGFAPEDIYNNYNGQRNKFRHLFGISTDVCTSSGTLAIIDGSKRVAEIDKNTVLDDDYWGKLTGVYNMGNDNVIEYCYGVNPANVGVAIAVGSRNLMQNCKVFSNGTLTGSTTSGCGWYLSDQGGFGEINQNTVKNMASKWNNGTNDNHSFFDTTPPNNDTNATLSNNVVDSTLSLNLLPEGAKLIDYNKFIRICLAA